LPACVYDAIRKAFLCSKDKEFTGFELMMKRMLEILLAWSLTKA